MRNVERSGLFARARGAGGPTDDDRKRVRAALARRIGIAAGATIGTTMAEGTGLAGTSTTLGLGGAGAIVKVVTVVIAVAAVTAGTLALRSGSEHPQGRAPLVAVSTGAAVAEARRAVIPATNAVPVVNAVPSSTASPAPPPSVTVTTPTRARSAPTLAAPILDPPREPVAASPSDRVAQELALIQQMQAALRAGDAAGALALVAEHERRFADGQLVPEREGAQVLALCQDARRDRAAELGRAFLDGHPRSPVAARVRATCGLGGTNDFDTGRGTTGQ